MKVVNVRPAKSDGYIMLTVLDGSGEKKRLTVSEEDYAESGMPMANDTPSQRDALVLLSSDERYRARLFALRILSYSDNNEKTLVRKLISRGIGAECASDVAREMVSVGYINEQRQLMRLVAYEANTALSGPRKIRAKLRSRGYSATDIDLAIENLTHSGEIDFERSSGQLVEKKLTRGATDEEIKKLLYRYGYSVC